MLKKSLPNFVFYAFGAFDSHLVNFTQEQFMNSYIELIKETQNLPSHPMVFLMVPVFTCKNKLVPDGVPNYLTSQDKCSAEASIDMQKTILEIANKRGIPQHHIINAY